MMADKRLIDANEYKKILADYAKGFVEMDAIMVAGAVEVCMEKLDRMPTMDAVEVVHGRWELGIVEPGYFTPGGNRPWVCSECGYLASWMLDSPTYNYCPNCGAKMDGNGNGS